MKKKKPGFSNNSSEKPVFSAEINNESKAKQRKRVWGEDIVQETWFFCCALSSLKIILRIPRA